jgi:hypothetical protein
MKKLIEVTEVAGEGLEALMGENVALFCLNYIYSGKLVGVNSSFVKLENPSIVYETGAFNTKSWKDAQTLHTTEWYVQTSAIESYGLAK